MVLLWSGEKFPAWTAEDIEAAKESKVRTVKETKEHDGSKQTLKLGLRP
jgi:hypothetical protein